MICPACRCTDAIRWTCRGGTHLQDVEGGWVEEVEGDEVEDPHQLMDTSNTSHIPQHGPVIPVTQAMSQRCTASAVQGFAR
jgi:hypothetical protein